MNRKTLTFLFVVGVLLAQFAFFVLRVVEKR